MKSTRLSATEFDSVNEEFARSYIRKKYAELKSEFDDPIKAIAEVAYDWVTQIVQKYDIK
jgi:hypothetical protein